MQRELLRTARGAIERAVESGTARAAERVDRYVEVAREASASLRSRGEPGAAAALERAATLGSSVETYLRESDGARLLRDVERFARDRAPVLGGIGLAGGFALARMLRLGATRGARDVVSR